MGLGARGIQYLFHFGADCRSSGPLKPDNFNTEVLNPINRCFASNVVDGYTLARGVVGFLSTHLAGNKPGDPIKSTKNIITLITKEDWLPLRLALRPTESAEIMRDELSRPTLAAQSIALYLSLIGQFTSLKSTACCQHILFTRHHPLPLSSLRPSLAPISLPACSAHFHRGNGMTHTRALFVTSPIGLLVGVVACVATTGPAIDDSPLLEPETQKDSEPTDLFASVVVGPPPRTLPPPRPSLRPPPPATTSSSTKSKTAGSKKAEPHATYTTPRNLYLAVYALDVGGSTAEFSERSKALEQEKPPSALFQKKASAPRPSLEDIRKTLTRLWEQVLQSRHLGIHGGNNGFGLTIPPLF
ncbi:hypothetical protein B0H14DRAFT_2563785 [Mycena olivaceomarginata]|nr:hypothetical protein B0H14DRAFT_2563785 [Mycena olivaceomarginata]